ncbi:MAG TPA: flagellar motor protein MotB [Acetobacteraceae bacterium]|nr:flagellar motor protein MotB [Acetobacteraceae bacterium]
MARKGERGANGGSIVIRKEETVEGGHHGGAWKVAYADFVTAMMAFFLLMWLLNATTEQQRRGIADYFSATNTLSHSTSGTGLPFGGETPYAKGTMISDRGAVAALDGHAQPQNVTDDTGDTTARGRPQLDADGTGVPQTAGRSPPLPPNAQPDPDQSGVATRSSDTAAASGSGGGLAAAPVKPATAAGPAAPAQTADQQAAAARQERTALEKAAAQIRAAVSQDPELAKLARQLTIDMTPDGLRIQILDEDRRPMFATGSATPNQRAQALLEKIAPVLTRLPEPLSIAGYTDAAPYAGTGRSNWELSADRANATRRLLMQDGVPESRIISVTGHADHDLLLPAQPLAAANRRIAIVVQRLIPQAAAPAAPAPAASTSSAPAGRTAAAAAPAAALPVAALPVAALPVAAPPPAARVR